MMVGGEYRARFPGPGLNRTQCLKVAVFYKEANPLDSLPIKPNLLSGPVYLKTGAGVTCYSDYLFRFTASVSISSTLVTILELAW